MAKPVHKLRIGTLSVAIWENSNDNGSWYSVTPARGYKDGEIWKDSDSFGFDDLLTLAKLLDQAHSWIQEKLAQRPPAEQAVA
jgi:hypothetical protein